MTCSERQTHGRRRACGDAGFAGGAEVLPFGLLTFVVGALVVANAWAVVDAKLAVTAASREAARAYVEASDPTTAAQAAHRAATASIADAGRDPARLTLRVDGPGLTRCARAVAHVTYPVPAVLVPWIGGLGDPTVVHASHAELVDPYRDGLPAGGGCG